MAKQNVTAKDIVQLLRVKYSGDQWAFVPEVPNGTGTAMNRRCDGLAMGLWPSKGLHLHGHEIKVNRSDWLKEIQDVSKAAAFSVFCHYWWIVAPAGVVKLEELPSDWGLMCPTTNGLRVKKPATLWTPELPDHCLLAGIFRACCKESAAETDLKAARQEGYSKGYDDGMRSVESRIDRKDNYEFQKLKESVAEFKVASGIEIRPYGGKRLGEIVHLLEEVGLPGLRRRLEGVARELSRSCENVMAAIEQMPQSE